MPRHLLIPLLIVVLPFLAISGTLAASVLIFRYRRDLMRAVDPVAFPKETKLALSLNDWAEEHGFSFLGSYQVNALGSAYVAAWEKEDEPTYFCVYYLNQTLARDFVTILDGTGALTTGNSADALLFPCAPRDYKQTFPATTIQQQWDRHREALDFLKRSRDVKIRSDYATFEEALNAGLREPMKYVMSLFLWPLRGPYWYFLRRTKMRNLPVEDLIKRGWIK